MTIQPANNRYVWHGKDFKSEEDFSHHLSQQELEELFKAAKSLPTDTTKWIGMSPESFDTPTLSNNIAKITDDLENGRGIGLIRGIDLKGLDDDMIQRLYWIIAVNLGDVIPQNAKGELMGGVQVLVKGPRTADVRGYVSNEALRFHCDGGDVAALFCIRQAPVGGRSALVSLPAIHNIMLEECPDLLEVLYKGYPIYIRKELDADGKPLEGSGQASDIRLPAFSVETGRVSGFINLKLFELAYTATGRKMPERERAALDKVEEIAEREAVKINFKMVPGDIFLMHNLQSMHKRTAFEDDPAAPRLLLRLWYNIRGARKLNPILEMGPRAAFKGVSPVIRL